MAFEGFRQYGAPTFYEAVHIPWEGDLLTTGIIFCFGILAISFYIILPGLVGKEKAFSFVRVTVSMFIGAVILVSNFAMTWETAQTQTVTQFRAGSGQNVNVTIGVNIGFRGVNITLKGEKDQIKGETIDYNEHFNWEGLQGRAGFGPSAGQFNKQYRSAQLRGIPLAILTVAEYFTIDGEGIRWGRNYRQAGWYSHITLWLAFPLWILSNILFFILLRYGAYFLTLTGLSMITSNIIWATLRNSTDLKIQFTLQNSLVFSYGTAFWICLITGIICVVLGIAVFLLDKLFPTHVAVFFSVDVLQDSEHIVVEEEELEITDTALKVNEDAVNSSSAPVPELDPIKEDDNIDEDDNSDAEGFYQVPPPPILKLPASPDAARPYVMRPHPAHKRSFRTTEYRMTKILQRPRRRDASPRPLLESEGNSDGDYINEPATIRAGSSGAGQIVTFSTGLSKKPSAVYHSTPSANVMMTGYEKI